MDYYITDYKLSDPNALALEDSIMQKGKPATAGSKILENFISPFDAEVVSRLSEKGIKIAGKTKMDEFGICSLTADKDGEVSGAVRAVADGAVKFSLCNDLFGKYRRQSAENACCYIHPTYGTVSRFGLIQAASSIDQIGVVCKDLREGFGLLSLIAGYDEKDGAMFPEKSYSYERAEQSIKIGVPESIIARADSNMQEAIKAFADKFSSVNIEIENFDICKQIMCILACAEISHNINRYDGIKFGYRASGYKGVDDLYIKTRTEAFGTETKLAAVLGAMLLDQDHYSSYYEKAMKVRRLIKEALRFEEYDVIVLPCKIDGDSYENLSLYALAALAGLPSISFNYKGQGIQLIANVKNENLLLTAWEVGTL